MRTLFSDKVYEQIQNFYGNQIGTNDAGSGLSELATVLTMKKALRFFQSAEINYAFFKGLAKLSIYISNDGFQRISSTESGRQTSYQYQMHALEASFKEDAFTAIDLAFRVLESNGELFPDFVNSSYYTIVNHCFIKNADEFSNEYGISNSRVVFLNLIPHMMKAQDIDFPHLLGHKFHAYLKENIKSADDGLKEIIRNSTEGIPYDLYCADPERVRNGVAELIAREGAEIRLPSINKQQWHIALLRSGEGARRRAAWLDYDAGGAHGHLDGLNLGLFANGLDLMPEFGYPAVQFGGWDSPRGRWYTRSAVHNTVLVDGANQPAGAGETTLWAEGSHLHAIRAAAPALNGGRRFERTVVLVDLSPETFYVVDVFRAAGGHEHTKFMQSHFGALETTGLTPQPVPDYGHDTLMRNFRLDPDTKPGWHADWRVEDRYKLLPEGTHVNLRYTDFTTGARAGLIEAWLVPGSYGTAAAEEIWLPRVAVRVEGREGEELQSTFVGIIEPYEIQPAVTAMQRLPLEGLSDTQVALLLQLAGGRKDLLILRDPEIPVAGIGLNPGVEVYTDAELCWLRLSPDGAVEETAVSHATHVKAGDKELQSAAPVDFQEWPPR